MRIRAVGLLLGLIAAAAVTARPTSAHAQAATCTVHDSQEARQTEARARFQQAQQLLEAEQFDDALMHFECSFQNVPHPSTLYNIARASELAGEFRRALDVWRGYLRMSPEAEDRAEVERRIAALEGMSSGGTSPTPPPGGTGGGGMSPTPPPPPPPAAAAAAPTSWETPEGAATDVYTPRSAEGQEYQVVERRPPSPWRYYSWYIMGTGVVAAVIGLYLAIPDLNIDVCADSYDSDGAYDPLNTCAITGYTLLGVGAALVLSAGLIWLFSEPGGEYVVTRRAALAPNLAFDPDGRVVGAGASYLMRF